MKRFFYVLTLLTIGMTSALMLTSCHDDNPDIPQPMPLPTNELVDMSVNPGDDFYSYCNGNWLKNHPLAPGQSNVRFWSDSEYTTSAFAKILLSSSDPLVQKLLRDIDNRDNSEAAMNALRQKTNRQLAEIEKLTTIDEVVARAGTMSMRGYRTGLMLHSEPVEGRVQTVLEIEFRDGAASAEAWEMVTGCSAADALSQSKACSDILNSWRPDIGIAIRTYPYEGNEVVEGRRILANAIGVPAGRLIYGETINQDDFLKKHVRTAEVANWKIILKNAIVAFNYKWTFATKEELTDYLVSSYHPFAYRMTRLYAEHFKDKIMREFIYEMVEEIRESFIEMIEGNKWLAASTRQAAVDKARKLDSFVGYPDTWQEARMGAIPAGTSLLEDMEIAGEEWAQIVNASRTDTPSRDDMWYSLSQAQIAPYEMNAMNMTESNGLYMYLPMLLPNTCRQNVPDSYNYAMVGAIAGHELGHGFDTAGYLFGSKGEWNNWWTANDKQIFDAKAKQLADYNSAFRPFPDRMPDLHSRGDQTSVEDVADLNGLNAVYRAMIKHYKKKGATPEELKKASQEFFLAYGNLWCGNFSDEYIIKRIETNIHSIHKLRVNGIVCHMDEWYDAYNIKPSDKLYLAPEKRVRIWND